MTTNLRTGLTAAAVALLTAVPASAAHAAPLQTPVQIDNMGGYLPSVAVNAGSAIVGLPTNDAVKVATSAGAGQWNPTIALSSPTAKSDGVAVTVDEDGTQTAVWGEYFMISAGMGMPNPGPTSIYAATRTAVGAWSTPEKLSPAGAAVLGQVSAVVGTDGRVTATWLEDSGDVYFTTRPLGGAWSPRTKVTGAEAGAAIDLAAAKDGTVTAVWRDTTSSDALVSTLRDGAWTAPVDVSGAAVSDPALDMTPAGDATVVWKGSGGIFTTRRAAGSTTWTAPEQISGNNGNYGHYAPGLVVERSGRATAAWSEYGSGGYHVYTSERAADGTWSANRDLGPGDSSKPTLAATPDGEVHVAWYGLPTRIVSRAADGTWGSLSTISAFVNSDPVIAADEDGDVVIAGAPNGSPVQVAGFDNAGPGLTALSVPASAQVGAAVTFSVSPIDLWSGLGTTTWSFGDGTTGTGTTVTHTFATTGTKKITVTATDTFGRARTRTRALSVTQAVAPTPEPPAPGTDPTPPAKTPGTCTPRALTTVKWKLTKGTKVRRATITVSGDKKARKLKRTARSFKLDLRKAKGKVVTVTIRTRTTKGKLVTKTQRYTLCS
ncbi:PKD domain-containing protein [Solirubrobacter phytolaccae]|uniref:PKD domain-containing protein n=1 Tax=Solirubrobacter phytolaccae TaxID=1404360 RepID=A0A9X3S8Q9_9ACTN|nr:PKD domain-containing protein [Solirubrobacter phytolaccae]MDA0181788.1 PKD domain-containing protein [Solirubrobacter phytolaccae]